MDKGMDKIDKSRRRGFKTFSFAPSAVDREPLGRNIYMHDTGLEGADGGPIRFPVVRPSDAADADVLAEDDMPMSAMAKIFGSEEGQALNFVGVDMGILAEDANNPWVKAFPESEKEKKAAADRKASAEMLGAAIEHGIWMPLAELEARGYRKSPGAVTQLLGGVKMVRMNCYFASTSNMRQQKLIATDLPFSEFARKAGFGAEFLVGATHDGNKAMARLSLIKSAGAEARGFGFTHAALPDLYGAQEFRSVLYDAEKPWAEQELEEVSAGDLPGLVGEEDAKKLAAANLTDGCGFITPAAARLAESIGLPKRADGSQAVPSGFQIRLGPGVKGMLFVFPFDEYTKDPDVEPRVKQDILLTESMVKANFDWAAALAGPGLMVSGITHGEREAGAWNTQMLGMLGAQDRGGAMRAALTERALAPLFGKIDGGGQNVLKCHFEAI